MTGFVQSVITIVLFVLILGVLVVIHEIGHFVTARLANVRVLEFGIGFPPRARVLRSKGETLYTLNYLPLGGFVKLDGEDGDAVTDPRSFSSKSLPVRLWILVAGVLMNVLLAFVIFTALAFHGDPTFGLQVGTVQPDSPAQAAGVQSGDVVVSVNGAPFGAFDAGGPSDSLAAHAGETVAVGFERPGAADFTLDVTLRTPAEIVAHPGALGVSDSKVILTENVISYTPVEAIQVGAQRTVAALGLIIGGLGALVHSVATDPTGPPPVSGPVGIATQIGDVFWQLGPLFTLYVAAVLSANLAVVNVLPFPPLDGGRMLMITLKRFFGARISLRAEQMTYVVGFVFLFGFIIWVTGFDIARIVTGGRT
jgi:regulator of sigma E protease